MFRFIDMYSTGSTSLRRSLIAFIAAPLVSSLLVVSGVVLAFMLRIPAGDEPPDLVQVLRGFIGAVFFGTLMLGGPLTFIGMLVVGFPAWLLLRFTHNESAVAYALLGALGGWWLAPRLGGHKWAGFPLDTVGACEGALALFLFWRMARTR
jgi:hypothetical protein